MASSQGRVTELDGDYIMDDDEYVCDSHGKGGGELHEDVSELDEDPDFEVEAACRGCRLAQKLLATERKEKQAVQAALDEQIKYSYHLLQKLGRHDKEYADASSKRLGYTQPPNVVTCMSAAVAAHRAKIDSKKLEAEQLDQQIFRRKQVAYNLHVKAKNLKIEVNQFQTQMEFQAGSNPTFYNINVQTSQDPAMSSTGFGLPSFTMPHSPPSTPDFSQFSSSQASAHNSQHRAMPQLQQGFLPSPYAAVSSSAPSVAQLSTAYATESTPVSSNKLPTFAMGELAVRTLNKNTAIRRNGDKAAGPHFQIATQP
jgi:hypothetical protein